MFFLGMLPFLTALVGLGTWYRKDIADFVSTLLIEENRIFVVGSSYYEEHYPPPKESDIDDLEEDEDLPIHEIEEIERIKFQQSLDSKQNKKTVFSAGKAIHPPKSKPKIERMDKVIDNEEVPPQLIVAFVSMFLFMVSLAAILLYVVKNRCNNRHEDEVELLKV
ncbi:hypothetical protein RF11_13697 [Thelohanellus kitauei]|uniref:Uncharacterized protein n=1 Tax=Thelohanellus kitauei TaxID=669202 RepID=A0A0C2ILF2_THEKT|nr:hypothetical protein RF11_13697 [Thelohanellus kitauei]